MMSQKWISNSLLWKTIILNIIFTIYALAQTEVKIWEEPLTIPTYLVGEPERNPMFYHGRAYQGAKGPIYPYPLLDKLTNNRVDKIYKALYLENEYIQFCVLPEIGGRIFFARDKSNGYDFFYRQHVIKPALIGMLGAWISGGVEWNVPHHHRASTFMNVDYTLTENDDGSKTIWVGEMELRHRMRWMIGLTLYPGKSYIEAKVKIINRTPLAHSILCFANVAVHANKDYQVIFPPGTEFATYHGKNQFSRWPIADSVFSGIDYSGVDVSWWKNHPSPISFFAWNYEEDFLAGYDHSQQAGVVHVGDHHIIPGKKFFAWGNGPQNEMWDKILTETDGSYLELMVGAYSDNQPDYSWCQPYEVKSFKQYWYPIRQIKGIKNANNEAALNLDVTEDNLVKMGLYTTSKYYDAKLVLHAGKRTYLEKEINIDPANPFCHEITLPENLNHETLKLTVYSGDGRELIGYSPVRKEKNPLPNPVEPPLQPQEVETIEELYLTGLRLEQFYNPALEPDPYYEEALKKDPGDYRSNTALGILYCKRGLFEQAEEKLRQAVNRASKNYTSPKDGEAFYYLGVALRAQAKDKDAYDAFYKSTWSMAWNSAGYLALTELECLRANYIKALEFVNRAIATNAWNTKAQNLKAGLLRKLKRFDQAEKIVSDVVATDPLDFWALNERYLIKLKSNANGNANKILKTLSGRMRDEAQSYLELALDYGNCGFWDEAIDVLSRLVDRNKRQVTHFPMIYYYLGYYWQKKGQQEKSLQYYKQAGQMPPEYCFPFRWESKEVLEQALKKNPNDSRALYYLGNLLYDHQPDLATIQWEKSGHIDDSYSITHRNLGMVYARNENNLAKAITSLEKALVCDKTDARLYFELDKLYEATGASPHRRLKLLEDNHDVVKKYDDALTREIRLHVQLGNYDRAIDLLQDHTFHVWEGGGSIHDVYVAAHLLRGKQRHKARKYHEALEDFEAALEYPDNLQVGRPSHGGRASQIYYFIGITNESLDQKDTAREFYKKSITDKHGWSEVRFYQGLAYKKLGEQDQANEIFEGLINFAQKRLETVEGMNFFAKFGEQQSARIRQANFHYLMGLGYLGKGQLEQAKTAFEKTQKLNINHVESKDQLTEL